MPALTLEENHVRSFASTPRGRRPKLAIAVGLGWGVRNYLLGDTFAELKRHYDILIITPYAELPDFAERFAAEGARVAGRLDAKLKTDLRLYENLVLAAFYGRRPTKARENKLREMERRLLKPKGKNKVRLQAERALHWCWQRPTQWCAPLLYPVVYKLYRHMLDRRWKLVAEMREILAREQVDAVFSTNYVEPWEWAVSLAARDFDLPVVTAITSWDNPTTKKFPICDYTGYLVWSEQMKRELVDYVGIEDDSRIHITGAPQFDFYHDPRYHQSRDEFCRAYGLDPRRKIVVYSTVTPGLMPDNPEVIRQVHDLWSKQLPGAPQLLVRLHPKDRLERYDSLRHDPLRQDIVWTLAGSPRIAAKDQWCPEHDDMVRAVNTVRHGDVNIHAGYSTMMLDFAALDKPVVIVGYDSQGDTAKSRQWESYEHLRPVVESDAVQVAYTPAESERYLRRALETPEFGRAARRQLIEFELGRIDGQAGLRAAQAVHQIIQSTSRSRAAAA